MNADEIQERVGQDVGKLTEYKDDVEKTVVAPSVEIFECLDGEDLRLWIVGRKDEFYIAFDESSGQYGLAFRNILGNMVYLGEDGNIGDAYHTLVSREEENSGPPRKKKS